ncbi:21707_t:CDS:2 [Dentiscutata erythropus]|uniref:21707_t:CDS:1 n=1 Tax=Dentiscutata erythropus TaxID=1348616 RepID=A0A9N9DS07_9GLOM|nr:21707_t:CDS:2 [Dentiscutata erythropus]
MNFKQIFISLELLILFLGFASLKTEGFPSDVELDGFTEKVTVRTLYSRGCPCKDCYIPIIGAECCARKKCKHAGCCK